jgi:hypothetical protein
MSNFFKDIINKADKLEDDILGPDYPYYKFVRNPKQLDMSADGNLTALKNDIAGIISYVELLVGGRGRANGSRSGQPLGNQFFLKTGGKCRNYKDKKLVQRSMYVNNVPNGDIDFLKDLTGYGGGGKMAGLVPGIMNNMNSINPIKMFSAFTQGNNPLCAEVTLPTIDENSNVRKKTAFVPINELLDLINNNDIKDRSVLSKKNYLKNVLNKEGFQNLCNNCKTYTDEEKYEILHNSKQETRRKDSSIISKLYLTSVSLLIVFIFYRYYTRSR